MAADPGQRACKPKNHYPFPPAFFLRKRGRTAAPVPHLPIPTPRPTMERAAPCLFAASAGIGSPGRAPAFKSKGNTAMCFTIPLVWSSNWDVSPWLRVVLVLALPPKNLPGLPATPGSRSSAVFAANIWAGATARNPGAGSSAFFWIVLWRSRTERHSRLLKNSLSALGSSSLPS